MLDCVVGLSDTDTAEAPDGPVGTVLEHVPGAPRIGARPS